MHGEQQGSGQDRPGDQREGCEWRAAWSGSLAGLEGAWSCRPGLPVWLLLRPRGRGLLEMVRCGNLREHIPVNLMG